MKIAGFFDKITISKRKMAAGVMLVLLGIVIPSFLHVGNMRIYPDLLKALKTGEKLYIILAASKLVLLNGIRSFPHYLGAFFLGEAVSLWHNGKEIKLMKTLIVCCLIPLVYVIIEKIYYIRYDFGMPAVLIITFLVILERIDFNMINIIKKSLMVAMMIVAFQWLDVMPSLSGHFFGRGETSNDIKNAAILVGGNAPLQYISLFFFLFLFFNAILLCKLILDENNIMIMSQEKRRSQQILMETRMREVENRTYMELRQLVHDLKSPLTSVQALVGVIKLGSWGEREMTYLTKIESSVEQMSCMISEILYEDKKSPITACDMITSILSQISSSEYAAFVECNNHSPDLYITVNKIRFSRAIINLLENASYALNSQNGKITLTVEEENKDSMLYACIKVEDNGIGIPRQKMKDVWKIGYSSRNSLGLGLNFVQKVVEGSGGSVDMESIEGQGTTVTIYIPAEYPLNIPKDQENIS